jgi:hypothetical protein
VPRTAKFNIVMCRLSRNCGILKILEPSGHVETCNEVTNGIFANEMLVWILITFHEVSVAQAPKQREKQS